MLADTERLGAQRAGCKSATDSQSLVDGWPNAVLSEWRSEQIFPSRMRRQIHVWPRSPAIQLNSRALLVTAAIRLNGGLVASLPLRREPNLLDQFPAEQSMVASACA